jgi:hypothetical protein
MATVWPPEASVAVGRRLVSVHITGPLRTLRQDIAFGIDQLVEIAIRALSTIMAAAPPGRSQVLLDQAAMIARVSERTVPEPADQADVAARHQALLVAAATRLKPGDAQQEQQHPRADDRPDEADGVEAVHAERVVLDQVLQEAAHEGAGDAEQDGAEDADRVTAGHQQAGDRAHDQPDDHRRDDEANHVGKTPS